jgi:hypothetical protein
LLGYDVDRDLPISALVDLSTCTFSGCDLVQVPDIPVWSPGGRESLVMHAAASRDEAMAAITFADSWGQTIRDLDPGASPFWLDEQSYGYLTAGGGVQQVAIFGRRDGTAFELRLRATDLAEIAPGARPVSLNLRQALVTTGPRLLLTAADMVAAREYVFALSWDKATATPGPPELLMSLDLAAGQLPSRAALSPDGRWLRLNGDLPQSGDHHWRQHLYDLREERLLSFTFDRSFVYDLNEWSADGRWLARLGNGFIGLLEPATGQYHLILHDFRDCTGLAWVK